MESISYLRESTFKKIESDGISWINYYGIQSLGLSKGDVRNIVSQLKTGRKNGGVPYGCIFIDQVVQVVRKYSRFKKIGINEGSRLHHSGMFLKDRVLRNKLFTWDDKIKFCGFFYIKMPGELSLYKLPSIHKVGDAYARRIDTKVSKKIPHFRQSIFNIKPLLIETSPSEMVIFLKDGENPTQDWDLRIKEELFFLEKDVHKLYEKIGSSNVPLSSICADRVYKEGILKHSPEFDRDDQSQIVIAKMSRERLARIVAALFEIVFSQTTNSMDKTSRLCRHLNKKFKGAKGLGSTINKYITRARDTLVLRNDKDASVENMGSDYIPIPFRKGAPLPTYRTLVRVVVALAEYISSQDDPRFSAHSDVWAHIEKLYRNVDGLREKAMEGDLREARQNLSIPSTKA